MRILAIPLEVRVAAGVQLVDQRIPDWFRHVSLNNEFTNEAIICWVSGLELDEAHEYLGIKPSFNGFQNNWLYEHGFAVPYEISGDHTRRAIQYLRGLWRSQAKFRLDAGSIPA